MSTTNAMSETARVAALASLCTALLCLHATPARGGDVVLDATMSAKGWNFTTGSEFPGAKGSMTQDSSATRPGIRVEYDFTGGGAYVGPIFLKPLPAALSAVKLDVFASTNVSLNHRIANLGGRTFQGHARTVEAGSWQTLSFGAEGPWGGAWGGRADERPGPMYRFSLLVSAPAGGAKKGRIRIARLRGVVKPGALLGFDTPEIDFDLAGWSIRGTWSGEWPIGHLDGIASPIDGTDGELSIRFPMMGRDRVQRISLARDRGAVPFRYDLPSDSPLNPLNAYTLTFTVEAPPASGSRAVVVKGRASDMINLGTPKSSREIQASPFGTCVHFAYGRRGAFWIWKDYERILDHISACGFKWIRDGGGAKKDGNGRFVVDPYNLKWIRAARRRGIETICVVDMRASEAIEDTKARAAAVARQTRGLVRVFELGNEPNNFGGWRQKYGGPWNGKEPDNSTSRWVVEHLRYSNAAAEAIHAERPEATIIGLGACTPTNFRYLDLGVSPLMTGVVDHPYTYSMPADFVPYGTGHAARDGVAVGDDQNTFQGLVESYVRKFRETGMERQLWVTEFGFSTFWFDDKNHSGLFAGFTERAQAVYLTRRFLLSLALPIAVSCQYDFIDDYGSTPHNVEANFGLLRADFSRKPAFYAVQRMNSLFAGHEPDRGTKIAVEADPLHRSQTRSELVKKWDDVSIRAGNGIRAFGFVRPSSPDCRMLAVWSVKPIDQEFPNRVVTIRVDGWKEYDSMPVAVDVVTGDRFDVPLEQSGEGLRIKGLVLGDAPLAIQLTRAPRK